MLAVNKPIFSTEITIKPRIKTTKHTMNDRMTPKSLISMVISQQNIELMCRGGCYIQVVSSRKVDQRFDLQVKNY